jgi:hypothetical protein
MTRTRTRRAAMMMMVMMMMIFITQLGRIPLKKLRVAQLVDKFPTLYETRRFIAVFTKACHWFLT